MKTTNEDDDMALHFSPSLPFGNLKSVLSVLDLRRMTRASGSKRKVLDIDWAMKYELRTHVHCTRGKTTVAKLFSPPVILPDFGSSVDVWKSKLVSISKQEKTLARVSADWKFSIPRVEIALCIRYAVRRADSRTP